MMVGKPELLAEMNKKLILDYLRKCGPQSRAELSRSLGLSFPSVSTNVEALLDGGLIRVREATANEEIGAGRKPVLFEYNADWGYVVSIDLGRYRVRMMVCNAAGTELKTVSFHLRGLQDGEVMNEIDRQFCDLLLQTNIPMEKVCCVCVGMPGIVNAKTGGLDAAPFLNQVLRTQRVDIHLAQKYNLKTCTGNSVNFAAIAEKWQGAGVEYSDIVYLDGAVGIGSAIIIGGNLVTGHNGAAGEVGYMLTDPAYRRETFNEIGPLEALFYRPGAARDTMLEDGTLSEEEIKKIRDYFAMAMVNLAAVVNPEVIIVGGGFGQAMMKRFGRYFEEYLKAHVPYVPRLIRSELDGNAAVMGAAAYALRLMHDEQLSMR